MTAEVMQFNIKGDSNITVHKADKDKQDILRIKEHLQNVIRASDIVFRASDEAISSSHLNIQRECLQSSDVVFRASDEAISDVFSEC
ncbi:hypothetical protein L6452_03169 [Arctium lappa]|uniref:Uncharacterized protein n=2 Tax=Arctium lappa TaxID=4217 RepID=A0ACB9FMC9_ARCLA|nr:hypothetical protein L6452_19217 [Arctium lappa]KAI3771995.1 hypothetical protein L6452_03169 [Arctium lappa]